MVHDSCSNYTKKCFLLKMIILFKLWCYSLWNW